MADSYLRYGDTLRIVNSYGGQWKGGYLGTGGPSNVPGAVSTVGAYTDPNKSTLWKILPGGDQKLRQVVNSGDRIRLKNTSVEDTSDENTNLLALFSSKPAATNGYPVGTTNILDDETITPAWYILVSTRSETNDPGLVDRNDIFLVASFGSRASVLDTNGVGSGGFRYDVTGARLVNRDGGSGSWVVRTSLTPD